MNRIAATQSRILVAATNVGDAQLVAELLVEDFPQVRISFDPACAIADFEEHRPQVLVLAFKDLEDSKQYYLELYRLSPRVHATAHRTIVLCDRSAARRAFELCRRQQFDDYVQFWPASYDPQRLAMSVLLAARSVAQLEPRGPGPMAFAEQARRVVELEALLQRQCAHGGEHIEGFSRSVRQVEDDLHEAMAALSRSILDHRQLQFADSNHRDSFQAELARLEQAAIRRPLDTMQHSLRPVRQWFESFNTELAPQLERTRELAELANQVRPLLLVVDDDGFQHLLLQKILADLPVDLIFATTGTEALGLLRSQRPDLILIDFMLPDTSGVELMKRLKAIPAWSATPMILITGASTKRVVQQSLRAGAADFVAKPLDRSRLIASLGRQLPSLELHVPAG